MLSHFFSLNVRNPQYEVVCHVDIAFYLPDPLPSPASSADLEAMRVLKRGRVRAE